MRRIYIYLTEEEYAPLEKKASVIGMSPSAYFKYLALLELHPPATSSFSLPVAMSTLTLYLSTRKVGDTFIVSSPFSKEWPSFTRSQKGTLSKQLRRIVDGDPSLGVMWKAGKNATVYVKL